MLGPSSLPSNRFIAPQLGLGCRRTHLAAAAELLGHGLERVVGQLATAGALQDAQEREVQLLLVSVLRGGWRGKRGTRTACCCAHVFVEGGPSGSPGTASFGRCNVRRKRDTHREKERERVCVCCACVGVHVCRARCGGSSCGACTALAFLQLQASENATIAGPCHGGPLIASVRAGHSTRLFTSPFPPAARG